MPRSCHVAVVSSVCCFAARFTLWVPRMVYLVVALMIAWRIIHFWTAYFKQIQDAGGFLIPKKSNGVKWEACKFCQLD